MREAFIFFLINFSSSSFDTLNLSAEMLVSELTVSQFVSLMGVMFGIAAGLFLLFFAISFCFVTICDASVKISFFLFDKLKKFIIASVDKYM